MADQEQNQNQEQEQKQKQVQPETVEAETIPVRPRWSQRRTLTLVGVALLALVVGLLIAGFFYLRSERFNRYLVDEIRAALKEYGLRAEIGELELGWRERTIRARQVKIYNDETEQLIATIGDLLLTVEIRDPYAFRFRREIVFKQLDLQDLDIFIDLDEQGRSNFRGLRQPPPTAPSRITFDYANLIAEVTQGTIHFTDRANDLSAVLDNLRLNATPLSGNDIARLQLSSQTGQLTRAGRQAQISLLELVAHLGQGGATIENFTLASTVGEVKASGQLTDWTTLGYNLKLRAEVALAEAARFFAPEFSAAGRAVFNGQVQGQGADYQISGDLTADELAAAGTRLRGLQANNLRLRPEGENLVLTSQQLRAQSVVADQTKIANTSAGNLRVVIHADRTELTAAQVNVGRVDLAQGNLAGIALRDLNATLRDGNYELRGNLQFEGGVINDTHLGPTRGQLVASNETVALNDFTTSALGGSVAGDLTVQLEGGGPSRLNASLRNLQTGELFKLVAAERAPLAGTVSGNVDISWPGMNVERLSGTINAQFAGATTETAEAIPVTGTVDVRARAGTFEINQFNLATDATTVTATGRLAPSGTSDLRFALNSTRAEQVQTIIDALGLAPEALADLNPKLAGELKLEGTLSGAIDNPTIQATLNATSVGLNEQILGSLSGRIFVSPAEIRVEDGLLTEPDGGTAKLTYTAPRAETATTGRLDATFTGLNADALMAALGLGNRPDLLAGEISGEAHLTNLPAKPQGTIDATLVNGQIAGQPAEQAQARIFFDGQTARLENVQVRLPQGTLQASGNLNLDNNEFQIQGQVDQVDLSRLLASLEVQRQDITGVADATFQISGNAKNMDNLKVELTAQGRNVTIAGRDAGELKLVARTTPAGKLDIELTTGITGKSQTIQARIDLREPDSPFEIETRLESFDIASILSIISPDLANTISGTVTGRLRVAGPLLVEDEFSLAGLRGSLVLTDVSLAVQGRPINVQTPFTVALTGSEINIEQTRIFGSGVNLALGGTIGLREGADLNFNVTGTLDLSLLNLTGDDLSLAGQVAVDARLAGKVDNPQLAGEMTLRRIAAASPDLPVDIINGTGRVLFSGNRIVLETFTATANDGLLRANGTITLAQLTQPSEWNFDLTATEMELYYQGVHAIINSNLALRGTPDAQTLSGLITIPQAEYLTNFDLGGLIAQGGGGGDLGFGGIGGPGAGTGLPGPPVQLDIRVEARESFLIRNEQVNTVASASLLMGGTLNNPELSGRVMLEGGTISFRGQRYEITAGTVTLPSGRGASPSVNLIAESTISGYQVAVGFQGPLDNMEVVLRSEPQLARAEILSLISTGRTDTGTVGSEQILSSGLSTAASLLSEEFFLDPLGREAEQLFGLTRFQIDPIFRPNRNPAARLTLSRSIGRNLLFTYSTNLSAEQDQIVSVEYNISNRFSAVASYLQGGSSTQQGTADNEFTIDIRGRKRFALGLTAPTQPLPANLTPSFARQARPPAEVDLDKPEEIKIGKDKLRELLPVIREGYSRALVRLGERNLINYLQEKGYFFAEVDAECAPTDCSGPDLRVRYLVRPGRRYDLEEIQLTGTTVLTKEDIIGDLQSQEDTFFGGIPFFERLPLIGGLARGLTSNDRLRRDREIIRRRLADYGFRSARVSSRLGISPTTDDLIVTFAVEEGSRSIVAEVDLRGNTVYSDEKLLNELPLQLNQPFSLTDVRRGVQQLNQLYAQEGYLNAAAELAVEDLADNKVRVVYHIAEGAQAIVKEIKIEGLSITREDSVRAFLAFGFGDVLTPYKIRQTQRDLYATGAFREVNVLVEEIANAPDADRRIVVRLTEAKPLLLVYGLGYSTDDGPRGLIELTNSNLFGRAHTGSLRLRGSRREVLAQLTYTDLRPFGENWPTTFSGFYNRNADLRTFVRRRIKNGKEEKDPPGRSFGIRRYAVFMQTQRPLRELTWLRFRYNFENAKLFNLENIPLVELTRNEKAVQLGMFTAGFTHDARDNAINPTRGYLVTVDHSLAARLLGGNESFNKFFGNYQFYYTLPESIPFLNDSVFAMAARVGLAAPFKVRDRDGDGIISEPERRLPISERFFAGGVTTLRGFRFEEAGPQAVLEPRNENELPTLVPLGGDAMTIFNFELRYPLTERFRLVPFYDLGNVFRRASDISFGGMTNTIGLGLRIITPVGPVGVDYGYLLDPPAFVTATGAIIRPPRSVFHIRFGQSF